MKKLILLASMCLLVHSSLYAQQVPNVISYQGLIQGVNGTSVKDSTYSVSISMWTNATGGTQVWRDVFQTPVKDGIFNIMLGSQVPLPASADMDKPLWLSVSVGGNSEAVTRSQLSAVPMAMNVADSSITAQKMATDYVSAVTVNGTPVTSRGSTLNFSSGDGVQFSFDSTTNSVYAHIPQVSVVVADPCPGTNTDGGVTTNTVVAGCYNQAVSPLSFGGYSTVTGGSHNKASGAWATIGGGDTNVASGPYSAIAGGDSNVAFYGYSFVGGGSGNYAGNYASVAGGQDNYAGGYWSFIGAGRIDSISGTGEGSSAIVAGYHNYIEADDADSNENFIGAGKQNVIKPDGDDELDASSIVGGLGNKIVEGPSFIGGGEDNLITQEWVSVVGGLGNIDSSDISFIGGGARNKITGADTNLPYSVAGVSNDTFGIMSSAIVAGFQNLSTSAFDFIGAGWKNSTIGEFSAIPGGFGLKLGPNSFAYNGESPQYDTAITDLSSTGAALSQVAYFGNINMMIGNVDSVARQLQFYSPQKSHTYSGAHYSSFQAGLQDTNINYTLPDSLPIPGQFLKVESRTGTNVQLTWDTVTGSGGGGGLAWLLQGNSSVPPGLNYLGTNDNEAFEIHIDNFAVSTGGNQRVMQYSEGSTSPNIIGGSSANTLGAGLSGAAVLSGGSITNPNVVNDSFSVIAGGDDNKIDTDADHAFIGSGRQNYINGLFSMIGGGEDNIIAADSADHNVITGGLGNIELDPSFGVIAGGAFNYLGWDSWSSSIGGGWNDSIFTNWATIGGGAYNFIDGYCTGSTIAGGDSNRIGAAGYAFIGGGFHNKAWGEYTTIGGGYKDSTFGLYSFLGGGQLNKIDFNSTYSTLGGGYKNYIGSTYGFIGGGDSNSIASNSDHSLLGGGYGNYLSGSTSVLVGGDSNTVTSSYSFLGSGQNNMVLSPWCVLTGGYGNYMDPTTIASSMVGGSRNTIAANRFGSYLSPAYELGEIIYFDSGYDVLVGGLANKILGSESVIVGGNENEIDTFAAFSTITGGFYNHALSPASTIAGGVNNYIDTGGVDGTISGGERNYIAPYVEGAAIPGGMGLVAQSLTQFVAGRFNKPQGTSSAGSIDPDDFLVIFGNGTSFTQSDAVTISNSGFISVYDSIGTGGANIPTSSSSPTRIGTSYGNNTIEAWGNVMGSKDSTIADVGVRSVTWQGPHTGAYLITLNVQNQDGTTHVFTAGHCAITASVSQGLSGIPGMISVQPITSGGTFTVTVFDKIGNPSDTIGFMFHVIVE